MDNKKLKVVSLEASNVLRLKAVRIEPGEDQHVVVIGGDNAQGKSAVLACIEMAMRGTKAIPPDPVHHGAREGAIRLDLGDIAVERFGPKLDKVVVRNAEGAPQRSPQQLLDKLYSTVSFDPMAFERMEPKKQLETLRKLLGLDFSVIDGQRAIAYEQRTGIGNQLKACQTRIADFPIACATAPDAEVSIAELLDHKRAIDSDNAKNARLCAELDECKATITRLREQLAKEEKRALDVADKLKVFPRVSSAEVDARLASAEDTNRLVRAKKERAVESQRCAKLEKEYADLTDKIQSVDAHKEEKLKAADWPVPGLGFSDVGVTYKGVPFEQASAAERRTVAFAIACALNPGLGVVLIPDASLLDRKAMKHIAEMAAEKDMQVWIERVGDGDPGAVIIEDGEVATFSDEA